MSNCDYQDEFGITALILAVTSKDMRMIKFLLKAGTNTNLQTNTGSTALMNATWLLPTNNINLIIRLLLDNGADPNIQDDNRGTALIMASDEGNILNVKLLLDHRVNINIQDNNGHSYTWQINLPRTSFVDTVFVLTEKNLVIYSDAFDVTNVGFDAYPQQVPYTYNIELENTEESQNPIRTISEDDKIEVAFYFYGENSYLNCFHTRSSSYLNGSKK